MQIKIPEIVKKHAFTVLISGAVLAWTFVKDTFATGAEVKHTELIVNIVTTDKSIDDHLRTVIEEELFKAMNNPILWYDALSNNYVSEYAESKSKEIWKEVEAELVKRDSSRRSFVATLGRGSGERDDKIMEILQEMIQEHQRKKGVRTLTAPF